ncbi:MAG: hypothetical protein JXA03_00605 [Bacteroidales bacterium]|nr:hypothetical protein [Bacteroidales bacterium]
MRIQIVILVATGMACLAAICFYRGVSGELNAWLNPKPAGTVKVEKYKDLNSNHLVYAKKSGIKPFKTNNNFNDTIEDLLSKGKLVRIKNGRNYIVEKLTHSHPYLVPEAAALIDEIDRRFGEKLKQNNKGHYYFKVSSLLRTAQSQKALSRSNINASGNSAHLYGTTFDIAYSKVVKKPLPWIKREVAEATVIKLLSETIGELRSEGRCLVVTEKQERCFHITRISKKWKD